MAKKEPNLVRVSSLQATDFVRVVTENGSSSRLVTVTNLAAALDSLINVADNQNNVRQVSVSTTMLSTDEVLIVDCSGADRAVLMMESSDVYDATNDIGQAFFIKMINPGSNKLTINRSGSDTIDGETSVDLFGPDFIMVHIQSTGSGWVFI